MLISVDTTLKDWPNQLTAETQSRHKTPQIDKRKESTNGRPMIRLKLKPKMFLDDKTMVLFLERKQDNRTDLVT
uniref:Uncharacterized protein n=1 Tax=Romanomermis culicivorax TaxID=13658 RepID=A0A915HLK3_ROMCU